MRAECLLRDRTPDCTDPSSQKESAPEAGSSRLLLTGQSQRSQVPAKQDPGFSLPRGAKGRPPGGERQGCCSPVYRREPTTSICLWWRPLGRGERSKASSAKAPRGPAAVAGDCGPGSRGWWPGSCCSWCRAEAAACGSEVGSEGENEGNGPL